MDDLGALGRVWREADDSATKLEAVILDLLAGQYKSPIRVVYFNSAEHWSKDVSLMSHRSCVGAAICSGATFRSSCKTSSIVTKAAFATSNCHSRCAWSEHDVSTSETSSQCQGTLPRLHRAGFRDCLPPHFRNDVPTAAFSGYAGRKQIGPDRHSPIQHPLQIVLIF